MLRSMILQSDHSTRRFKRNGQSAEDNLIDNEYLTEI